jgi:hypothetical protein
MAMAMAVAGWAVPAAPAMAQTSIMVPGAPAPVLAPPPPVAAPPPGQPPRLDTFGDRVNRCAHFGALQGLAGGQRDAYVRACANN